MTEGVDAAFRLSVAEWSRIIDDLPDSLWADGGPDYIRCDSVEDALVWLLAQGGSDAA